MRRLITTTILVLTLATNTQGAVAQIITDIGWELDDYPGLESAYTREYVPDPEVEEPSIVSRPLTIMAYSFDNDMNATTFLEVGEKDIQAQLDGEGDIITEFIDNDIADGGYLITFSNMDMVWSVFRVESTVFCIVVRTNDLTRMYPQQKIFFEDPEETLADVTDYIVNNDPKSDEVIFSSDGDSHGGAFDRMPPEGDDSVAGLTIADERDLLDLD